MKQVKIDDSLTLNDKISELNLTEFEKTVLSQIGCKTIKDIIKLGKEGLYISISNVARLTEEEKTELYYNIALRLYNEGFSLKSILSDNNGSQKEDLERYKLICDRLRKFKEKQRKIEQEDLLLYLEEKEKEKQQLRK